MAELNFKKKAFFVFIFSIVLILAGIEWQNRGNAIFKKTVLSSTQPFASFFSATGYWLNDKVSFWKDIGDLKKENAILLEENASLKVKLAHLKDVEQENALFRKEMSLAPRDKYILKPALIIRKNITSSRQLLYLDKGAADGIKNGMAVVVHQGVLVGQVIETFKRESIIEAIFSQDSNIVGEVLESSAKGIVRGEYSTAAILDVIPRNFEVKEGDTVITSGTEELIPRGLLIGQIKETTPTADLLFQKAPLVLPFQLDKLRLVWVVIRAK
jgi:rod shape-determining protein MreC